MTPDREYEREMEERMDEALYYASKDADDLAKADAEIAALKQRVAELERELEAARKMREFVELAAAGPDFHLNDYTRTIQEKAKAALAAYRQATQTKEPRDEKAK